MTVAAVAPPFRLWTAGGFRDDGWRHADSLAGAQGNEGIILPLAAFKALDAAAIAERPGRVGVLLAPGEPLAEIAGRLGEIALVALAFPAFNDGRSFSKAELLRRRHGYGGVIRASGQVLIDQIPLMLRTGFDEFEVSHPVALKRLEEGRIGGLPLHYQPAAKPEEPEAKYSWRRRPSA